MAPLCCIIPQDLLQQVIDEGEAPQDVIDSCAVTIEETKRRREARIQYRQSILSARQQNVPEGIIPSFIHEALAQSAATADLRQASLDTLAAHVKHRPAPGAGDHNLNRTVYDAHNSTGRNPPRDRVLIKEGGDLIAPAADPSQDPNECYIGFKKTYDFYFEKFGRDSIDGRGLPLVGFVHFGRRYQNAFWDGQQMVFGDGDGVVFNGFTDELDVIAHELTHGVIDHTCPLEYEFQSGALNEHIADVFGIMVKQWGEDPENPKTAEQSNWLIGEGIWASAGSNRALRDMANPGTAYVNPRKDPQPAHWDDFKKLPFERDEGGVHINSGIPNRAFYLASTLIGGFTWEGSGQIWYKAMMSGELGTHATFKEFADLTIANAGEHKDKIQQAWDGVGYPFPETDDRNEL